MLCRLPDVLSGRQPQWLQTALIVLGALGLFRMRPKLQSSPERPGELSRRRPEWLPKEARVIHPRMQSKLHSSPLRQRELSRPQPQWLQDKNLESWNDQSPLSAVEAAFLSAWLARALSSAASVAATKKLESYILECSLSCILLCHGGTNCLICNLSSSRKETRARHLQ